MKKELQDTLLESQEKEISDPISANRHSRGNISDIVSDSGVCWRSCQGTWENNKNVMYLKLSQNITSSTQVWYERDENRTEDMEGSKQQQTRKGMGR